MGLGGISNEEWIRGNRGDFFQEPLELPGFNIVDGRALGARLKGRV